MNAPQNGLQFLSCSTPWWERVRYLNFGISSTYNVSVCHLMTQRKERCFSFILRKRKKVGSCDRESVFALYFPSRARRNCVSFFIVQHRFGYCARYKKIIQFQSIFVRIFWWVFFGWLKRLLLFLLDDIFFGDLMLFAQEWMFIANWMANRYLYMACVRSWFLSIDMSWVT